MTNKLSNETLLMDLQLRIRALEDDFETLLASQARNLTGMILELQEAVAELKGEAVGMMFTVPSRPQRPLEDYQSTLEESK